MGVFLVRIRLLLSSSLSDMNALLGFSFMRSARVSHMPLYKTVELSIALVSGRIFVPSPFPFPLPLSHLEMFVSLLLPVLSPRGREV